MTWRDPCLCEEGRAGCVGHPAGGLRFGDRRRLTGDAGTQPDRIADTFTAAHTVTESLPQPVPDRVAVAKPCTGMFPAAGRDLIEGDDHGRSRRLAPRL